MWTLLIRTPAASSRRIDSAVSSNAGPQALEEGEGLVGRLQHAQRLRLDRQADRAAGFFAQPVKVVRGDQQIRDAAIDEFG
jgi:hypothetical protein